MAKTRDLKTVCEEAERATAEFYRAAQSHRDYNQSKALWDGKLHNPEGLGKAITVMEKGLGTDTDHSEAKPIRNALHNLEDAYKYAYHNITGGNSGQLNRIQDALDAVEKQIKEIKEIKVSPGATPTDEQNKQQEFIKKQQEALKTLSEAAIADLEKLKEKAAAETKVINDKINHEKENQLLARIKKGNYIGDDPNGWWQPDWKHEVKDEDKKDVPLSLQSVGENGLERFRKTKASVYKSPFTPYKIVYDEKTGSAYHANMMDPELAAKLGKWGGNRKTAEKNFIEGWKRAAEFLLLKKGPPLFLSLDPKKLSGMTQEKRKDYLRYMLEIAEHAHHKLGVQVQFDDFTRQQISILFGAPLNKGDMATRFSQLLNAEPFDRTQRQVDSALRNVHEASLENLQAEAYAKAQPHRAKEPVRMPVHEHLGELGKTEAVKEAETKFEKLKETETKLNEAKSRSEDVTQLMAERYFTVDMATTGLNKLDEYLKRLNDAKQEFDKKIESGGLDPNLIQDQIQKMRAHTESLVRCYERYYNELNTNHYHTDANHAEYTKLRNQVDKKITNVTTLYADELIKLEKNYEEKANASLEVRVRNSNAAISRMTPESITPGHTEFGIKTWIKELERAQQVLQENNEEKDGAKKAVPRDVEFLKVKIQEGYRVLTSLANLDQNSKSKLDGLHDKLEKVGVDIDMTGFPSPPKISTGGGPAGTT